MTATPTRPLMREKCADSMFKPGEPMGALARRTSIVETDVWRRVIIDGKETSYVKRERFRTVGEVCRDLYKFLDIWDCPTCGWEGPRRRRIHWEMQCRKCGADCQQMLDEYLSTNDYNGNDKRPVGPYKTVDVNAATGGNEGHYISIGALTETIITVNQHPFYGDGTTEKTVLIYKHWATIKTFRGMDHAHKLVRKITKLLNL
jgi:hypothetical protein